MKLLVADTHFDDKPEAEYRWSIFEDILAARPTEVYILGDLTHKKDRHPATLVNRFISEMRALLSRGIPITIIRGNHDEPLKGPPYWTFLNDIPGVRFINQPTADGRLLMLPHSTDPVAEWAGIDFNMYNAIFMHQPVSGVDRGDGRPMEVGNMVTFPRGMPVYSGDPHYPQNVRGIEYIGTPYPINFGESHLYRMLLLDDNFRIAHQIKLVPINKHSITVRSIEDLNSLYVRKGDQAKIEFVLPASQIEQWPIEQAAIAEWARANDVTVSATKATIETSPAETKYSGYGFDMPADVVLLNFAADEGIEEALLLTGYQLLEEALAEGLS